MHSIRKKDGFISSVEMFVEKENEGYLPCENTCTFACQQ